MPDRNYYAGQWSCASCNAHLARGEDCYNCAAIRKTLIKLPLRISDYSDDTYTIIEDANGVLLFQSIGDKRLEEAQIIVDAVNSVANILGKL